MALTPRAVTIDCADPQRLAAFWSEATGYRVAGDWDGYMLLEPADGAGLSLGLQRVSEPRTGKNRVHIDWRAQDPAAEIERLVKLGGTVLAEHEVSGWGWTVLADPEGNEFCVAG